MNKSELENRVRELELRQRIVELEQRLNNVQRDPISYSRWAYDRAKEQCDAYFKNIKFPDQWYAGEIVCLQAARTAYKERRKVDGRPERYALTEEDGEEFFQLFRAFADGYQGYLVNGTQNLYSQRDKTEVKWGDGRKRSRAVPKRLDR